MKTLLKFKLTEINLLFFAVNKVVKYLLQNGITPDFIIGLDASNMNKTLGGMEGYFSRSNCIMDIRTDSAILNKGFNKIFVNFSETDFFIKNLQNIINL